MWLTCAYLTLQVNRLIKELADAGASALGIELDEGTLPRLSAYAKSVAHFPTAVKEVKQTLYCGGTQGLN